jgi:hypothetical protein
VKAARLAVAFLGLHPERRRELCDRFGGPERLVDAGRRGVIPGVGPEVLLTAAAHQELMLAAGVRPMFLGDPGYPGLLAQIGDPPDVLFVRGELPAAPAVAVVGTRRSTRMDEASPAPSAKRSPPPAGCCARGSPGESMARRTAALSRQGARGWGCWGVGPMSSIPESTPH